MTFSEIGNVKYSNSLYLSTCDLINKNMFRSITHIPKVNKICLDLAHFGVNVSETSGKKVSFNDDHELESFFVLYLIKLTQALICTGSSSLTTESNIRLLQIVLRKEEDIYLFLSNLFVENLEVLKVKDSFFLDSIKAVIHECSLEKKVFALESCLRMGFLLDVEDFMIENEISSEVKTSKVSVYFLFEIYNLEYQKLSKDCIRNIPFFWISC